MYVLWLTSWFPNQTSPFNGDFIERHAVATSLYRDIVVIHAVKDETSTAVRVEERQLTEKCLVIIIYYPSTRAVLGIGKLLSLWNYISLQLKTIHRVFKLKGKPAYVHLHIIVKAGILALILKFRYGIPFIVSEQATHYLPNDIHPYSKSIFSRYLIKATLANTKAVTVVSKALGDAMRNFHRRIDPIVVPNVVDRRIFFPPASFRGHEPFVLIHISNFFPQKNTDDILSAFEILSNTDKGRFRLITVGGFRDNASRKGSEAEGIEFLGEMQQADLANLIRTSHALILYSHYETFGCVLIEAMACGIPVIVSDIPVFHETVREGINGIFVPPANPEKLAEKIREIRSNYSSFQNDEISKAALNQYSFERIGKLFSDLYSDQA